MFREEKLRCFIFEFILVGSVIPFYASLLYKLVENSFPKETPIVEINQYTSYVFICFGFT